MNADANKKIAFLVDFDNVATDVIEQALNMVFKDYGAAHIRRAYCNAEQALREQNFLKRLGLRAIVNLAIGKNSTDIALAVDAMDLAITEKPDVIVLVSSDSDFAPLVLRLREKGAWLRGFGQYGKTGDGVIQIYDQFNELAHGTARAAREGAAPKSAGRGGRRGGRAGAGRPAPEPVRAAAAAPRPMAAEAVPPAPPAAAQPVTPPVMPPVPPAVARAVEAVPAQPAAVTAEPAAEPKAPRRRGGARAAAKAAAKTAAGAAATPPAWPAAPPAPKAAATAPARPAAKAAPAPAPRPAAAAATEAAATRPAAAPAAKAAPRPAVKAGAATAEDKNVAAAREINAMLAACPRLADGQWHDLGDAAKVLKAAGLLPKSAPAARLFLKHPQAFELQPEKQPNQVRFGHG